MYNKPKKLGDIMKYSVGQILYLIGESSMRILPIQVIEEVVTTTVEGSKKTYTVLLPDPEETKVGIHDISGKIFTSRESVRSHMIKNATSAIDEMLNNAVDLSIKKFKKSDNPLLNLDTSVTAKKESAKKENVFVQEELKSDIIKVDLGDGKFAKMSSDSLQKIRS